MARALAWWSTGVHRASPSRRDEIQVELDRRRPGQSRITSHRDEADQVEILSGVEDGLTTGTPIALLVRNSDARSGDYDEMRTKYRPSHADYSYQAKYGIRSRGGRGPLQRARDHRHGLRPAPSRVSCWPRLLPSRSSPM